MIESPRVAVIVPAYNHERFVEASLRSIARQRLQPSELVVIDDGSADGTVQRVSEVIADLGIPVHFVRHAKNRGLCATLNEGLSLSSAEYVAVLASDDEMPMGKLESQVGFLAQHPEFDGLMADLELMDVDGNSQRIDRPLTQELGVTSREGFGEFDFVQVALGQSSTYIQTGVFRRSAISAVGGFDESLRHEDFDFALNLLSRGRIAYLYSVGARYRVMPSGLNRQFRDFEHEYQRVVEKHRDEVTRRGVSWRRVRASIWNRKANNRLNVGDRGDAFWCSIRGLYARPTMLGIRTTVRTLVPDRLRGLIKRWRQR